MATASRWLPDDYRFDGRWVSSFRDEVEAAEDVLESFWDGFGYFGDEWQEVWDALQVPEAAKNYAWLRFNRPSLLHALPLPDQKDHA